MPDLISVVSLSRFEGVELHDDAFAYGPGAAPAYGPGAAPVIVFWRCEWLGRGYPQMPRVKLRPEWDGRESSRLPVWR